MKFKSVLLAVTDMDRSIAFYREVQGLRVVLDFGANKTLTGGVCLQTKESWQGFLGAQGERVAFGGKDAELYFDEDDFDGFVARLDKISDLRYVHKAREHQWGQRAVRFYDPDLHIIEVGENIKSVCKRFVEDGMSVGEIAKRMDVPEKFVNACLR